VTLLQGFAGLLEGTNHLPPVAGSDGDGLQQAEQAAQGRVGVEPFPHQEADKALHASSDQKAIDK
jgi:hypothetical protein